MKDLTRLTQLKNKLDGLRPLTKGEVAKFRESERIEEVYNSNALEGNTITKFETKMILDEGITITQKPMKEHLEVINLAESIDYIEDLVREKQPLTERMIKELPTIVYSRLAVDRKDVGDYRRISVAISGSDFVPPEPYQIQEEMKQLIEWSEAHRSDLHPVVYAALLHEKFVTIHPFIDGNGRTARLLLNFALTEADYPPIVIKANPESRLRYNRSLEEAQIKGDVQLFVDFIAELCEEKLLKMIQILEMANQE